MKHKKIALGMSVSLFAAILIISAYIICTVRSVDFKYDVATAATEEEVLAEREKLNGYVGKNVFTVKADKIAASLSDNPYIKVVSVKVDFPAKVTVTVEERGEKFAVKCEGGYYFLDENEFVLDKREGNAARADGLPLPCISGSNAVFALNSAAAFSDSVDGELFAAAAAILKKFPDARNELEEITVSRYNDGGAEWRRIFVYTKEGASFVISEADHLSEEKAELVKKVFDELSGTDRVMRTVEVFTAENDTVDYE